MCSLRNPRINTDVNWPGVPVCTTDKPRHFAQSIAHTLDLFLLHIFRGNHAHAGGRLIERNIETRR